MDIINFSDKVDKVERFAHSNKLIEARYSLSLHEQRLVLMMVAMVSPNDEDFKEYKINIRDFADFLNVKGDSVIANVKRAAKSLVEKSITITDSDKTLYASWISSAEFPVGKSYVALCFDPKLRPYLLQLKQQYTFLENKYLIQLRSVYSIRIYMLLQQYSKIGKRVFEVKILREILGIKENEYPRFYDFNLNVITKAVSDINNKTDLDVTAKPYKWEGKKVSEIIFTIEEKKQFNLPGLEIMPNISDEESGIDFNKMPLAKSPKTRNQELKKSFEISYKLFHSDKSVKVVPFDKLGVRYKLCLEQLNGDLDSQINDYLDYLKVAGWRAKKDFGAWINDGSQYGNDWKKEKENELSRLRATAATKTDIKNNLKEFNSETEEIAELRQKIKKEFRILSDYDASFAAKQFIKIDNGFLMNCSNQDAELIRAKYQRILEKFNVKLEVK